MKHPSSLCLAALLCCCSTLFSQINFTANDIGRVPAYDGFFMYGTNGGWFDNSWDDMSLADIASGNTARNVKGVGVKTFRPPLPEKFLEEWGYDIRIREFNHYRTNGVLDNTVFLGEPMEAHRDKTKYGGCGTESQLFANLYEPIWDGGTNGTPINENNYYALYVYKVVTRYKSFVKFWEILNEPDYDIVGGSHKARGEAGNWWENNPNPCDMQNMRAPIFHYVRILRISYEVIKSIDPTAYVATGGLGYPSFLDAVLRNTDNPTNGSENAQYPHKGGAYFDVLSYHSYPMYNLRSWTNANGGGWVYRRHSDAAVLEHVRLKNKFDSVLATRGYNGTQYPKKHFIVTEGNIPRKAFEDHIGSDEAQRNYIVKTLIESQKNEIRQFYTFALGDDATIEEATGGFQVMGLYTKLAGKGPIIYQGGTPVNSGNYRQEYTTSGIAFKTTSDLLRMKRYDPVKTAALNLPATIGGAAFRHDDGKYTLVLWLKTSQDRNEFGTLSWSIPLSANVSPLLDRREWNFSLTNTAASIPATNITLTPSPIFLTENLQLVPLPENPGPEHPEEDLRELAFKLYPNPTNSIPSVRFSLAEGTAVRVTIRAADGKLVALAIPGRHFDKGTHVVPLTVVQSLAGGVYFCHFEANKISIMKKLVIAR